VPIALSPVQHHQQPVVLIVGMSGGVHEDAGIGQMPQGKPERNVALLFVQRNDPHLGSGDGEQRGHDKQRREDDALHMVIIMERAQSRRGHPSSSEPRQKPRL
jgi:hypothetical protein